MANLGQVAANAIGEALAAVPDAATVSVDALKRRAEAALADLLSSIELMGVEAHRQKLVAATREQRAQAAKAKAERERAAREAAELAQHKARRDREAALDRKLKGPNQ